jgi:Ser/Thr protein kinase RdoA (MazF antagonist)
LTDNKNTPYANLDPNLILDAIESVGYQCSGGLSALNSYENRVYQIGIEDSDPLIAKFYRPHRWTDKAILEEHQFALELAALEIPVVAPLIATNGKTLHEFKDFRFALFPRKGGRTLELDNLDQLEWMGRFLGRLHAVGACKSFQHRGELNLESYGTKPYEYLLKNNFVPEEIKNNFCLVSEQLLKIIGQRFDEVGDIAQIRLHGDCHAGNVLWNDRGPQIVDLDDCLKGPAVQDIWMLLSGDKEQVEIQLNYILRGYQEFYDFNYRELRLVESLRTLRMIRYSAWLAERWEDPAFPLSFPWFNTPRYWQQQLQDMREQLMLLQEEENSDNDNDEHDEDDEQPYFD